MRMCESFLIVPGLYDSDPNHWQTRWQQRFNLPRVVQPHWSTPDIDVWAQTLERFVRKLTSPVAILAHSFGCLATVFAATELSAKVTSALLVAPADPEKFGLDRRISSQKLPFPSIVVASRNDPWITFDRANEWADHWESNFVDLGKAGHINSESGFGDWSGGWELAQLLAESSQHLRATSAARATQRAFSSNSLQLD